MKLVVQFYYCVWKFSPSYQLWKSARRELRNLGTAMDGLAGSSFGVPSTNTNDGPSSGLGTSTAGMPNASTLMRFRGPRMRSTKRQNYKI